MTVSDIAPKPPSDRDRRIIERYAEGATLEEIGTEHDITRERARQIIAKHGGPDAQSARNARRAGREEERNRAREAFLADHFPVAEALAEAGATRAETVARVKALYPAIDADIADEALAQSDLVFDQATSADIFSNAVLEAGVWFLLGAELYLGADHEWAAVHLPLDLIDELGEHLTDVEITVDELARILGIIAAAKKHAQDDPALTITGARYDELRRELLEALGLTSGKGAKLWPPTRQTLMKRFGGWNEALASMGLASASRGRAKGLVVFSEQEYADAVRDFAAGSDRPTFAAYDAWVKRERAEGRRRPSGASIRNVYGSWLVALRNAGEAAGR